MVEPKSIKRLAGRTFISMEMAFMAQYLTDRQRIPQQPVSLLCNEKGGGNHTFPHVSTNYRKVSIATILIECTFLADRGGSPPTRIRPSDTRRLVE